MWQQAADAEKAKTKDSAPKIDKVKSQKMIEQYVHDESNGPGARNVGVYCEKMGMKEENFDAQAVIPALIKSLPKNEPLEVVARYLTLVHDYGVEWGGGKHNGFGYALPQAARLIAERLEKELKSGDYDLSDSSFKYILFRIGLGWSWQQFAWSKGYDEKRMTESAGLLMALSVFITGMKKDEEALKKKEEA